MRTLFRILTMSVAATVLASAPLRAPAQNEPGRWQVSLKCGAFFPGQGTMRDQATGEWWYAGIDLDPGFRYRPDNGTIRFGVDFDFRATEGRTVFTIPVLAKVTWPISTASETARLYGGLGVGSYFMNSRYSGAVVKPGAQFIAGIELGPKLFIEASYDWVSAFYDDEGNALRADGIKVAVGVRF